MEYFDLGPTRVVLLKKCGSSTLGSILRNRPERRGRAATRYIITFVRDPRLRLVSGWADLVRRCGHRFAIPRGCKEGEEYVFDKWAREVFKLTDEDLDHHLRPQLTELYDVLGRTPMQPDTQLIIGRTERINQHLPLLFHLVGIRGMRANEIEHLRRSQHRPFETYFDDELDALMRERFACDFALTDLVGMNLYTTPEKTNPLQHLREKIISSGG